MSHRTIPIINLTRCDLCGKCINACPVDALHMSETGPAFSQPITCTYCTDCESICPQGAIRAPLSITWAQEA